jgi:hypothetical protein
MKEINCNIIKDILPLYVDGVVSDDTKEMLEEHLEHCEECKKEVDLMKQELYIPAEKEASFIKDFKRKWRNKKLIISVVSILLTGLILFGAFSFVFHYEKVVPYAESLIKIEIQDNDMLVSHYYGVDYYSVSATHPKTLKIDGKEKNIIFLYYTETIANSPSKKLINRKENHDERDFIFPLDKKENVDAIYYVEFDSRKIFNDGNDWSTLLEDAILIWGK